MTCQRVSFQCYHCNHTTMIPVPTEFIDWRPISEKYRSIAQRIMDDMGRAIADIELIHGVENPVTQYYRNKWAMLLLDIQKEMGNRPRGTSAHARDGGEDQKEGWKHNA